MITQLFSSIFGVVGDVVKRLFPDPADQMRVQSEIMTAMMEREAEFRRIAGSIIESEVKGASWLQRNWRPLLMLTFATLIVMRWLGYSAPGLSEAEAMKLWDIIELGLGGYVIGRSAEKIVQTAAPVVAEAVRGRR